MKRYALGLYYMYRQMKYWLEIAACMLFKLSKVARISGIFVFIHAWFHGIDVHRVGYTCLTSAITCSCEPLSCPDPTETVCPAKKMCYYNPGENLLDYYNSYATIHNFIVRLKILEDKSNELSINLNDIIKLPI